MNDGTYDLRNVHVTIGRTPEDVYAFVSNGANLPLWASGLGERVRSVDGEWFAEGPLGRIKIRFAPPNELGVLDHDVTLESGARVHNPMRVIPNGAGATVIFSVLRVPGTSDQKFADDARWVEKDLTTLKEQLETMG